MPTEDDLRGCPFVGGRDPCDQRVVEDRALRQRAPGFGGDAVGVGELDDVALLQCGVQLDLVDGGDDRAGIEYPTQVLGQEVRDADRPDASIGVQLFEGTPGVEVSILGGGRPVDQVQVEVVEAETVQARMKPARVAS